RWRRGGRWRPVVCTATRSAQVVLSPAKFTGGDSELFLESDAHVSRATVTRQFCHLFERQICLAEQSLYMGVSYSANFFMGCPANLILEPAIEGAARKTCLA